MSRSSTRPKVCRRFAPRKITFSAYTDRADFRLAEGAIVYQNQIVLRLAETKLRGSHNIENLMATLAAGLARGLSFEEMVPPLCAYEPQPHRCEFVREVGGVGYINDSKATNLDAVEKGAARAKQTGRSHRRRQRQRFHLRSAPAARERKGKIDNLDRRNGGAHRARLEGAVKCEIANSLADAVERAHAIAKPGEVVLFSPGTSSFDMFKSYADRGDQFRALVQGPPQMKIKMPKLPKFPKRKKLRATTARRSFGASAEMDYEEMSEPNMKLSRALLIVLVLHIVAVAGIIAFNAIKTRQGSSCPRAPGEHGKFADCWIDNQTRATPKICQSLKKMSRGARDQTFAFADESVAERRPQRARQKRKMPIRRKKFTSWRKATIRSRSRRNSKFPTTI